MKEELNQKISQFLDNELHYDEALDLLQKMRSDTSLAQKMGRFEAISHAMKSDQFITLGADFSAKIAAQLEHEPIYLLPSKKPMNRGYQWLALAASLAVVSVVAVRSLPHVYGTAPASLQVAQQQPPKALPNSPVEAKKPNPEEQPLNARINDYLQAHNGSVYVNNPNLQSMTRVTTYNQK